MASGAGAGANRPKDYKLHQGHKLQDKLHQGDKLQDMLHQG